MDVTIDNDVDDYYLTISFSYANPTLTQLIQEGDAAYSVLIECKRNFFRELVTFRELKKNIVIKANELVGRVEISGFIKAEAEINPYRISGSHSDYGQTGFHIYPGDVLAVAPGYSFNAFQDYDPLTTISSFLTIQKSADLEDGPMKVDLNGDRIVATLSKRDYDKYTDLKADPSVVSLLANQVIVPVLMEAIYVIKDTPSADREAEMSNRWYRSILKKFDDSGIDIDAPDTHVLEVAQTILSLPLRRSLRGLDEILRLEDAP